MFKKSVFLFIIVGITTIMVVSIHSIPQPFELNELNEVSKKTVYFHIMGADELQQLLREPFLKEFERLKDYQITFNEEDRHQFTIAILIGPVSTTKKMVASFSYIKYFDTNAIKDHVAKVNWRHVHGITSQLAHGHATSLHVFGESEIENTVKTGVEKFEALTYY